MCAEELWCPGFVCDETWAFRIKGSRPEWNWSLMFWLQTLKKKKNLQKFFFLKFIFYKLSKECIYKVVSSLYRLENEFSAVLQGQTEKEKGFHVGVKSISHLSTVLHSSIWKKVIYFERKLLSLIHDKLKQRYTHIVYIFFFLCSMTFILISLSCSFCFLFA